MKKLSQFDLVDQHSKIHIRVQVGKKGWDRYVSIDRKTWNKTHSGLSMEEVLTIKEEAINNNYKNLFKIITKK